MKSIVHASCDRQGSGFTASTGQAMIEYVIVAGMLVSAAAILAVFLFTFRQQGGRILDLVASEFP